LYSPALGVLAIRNGGMTIGSTEIEYELS
jgi:hypothetical protein